MLELIEIQTTHLGRGRPEGELLTVWINPRQIVRIDPCDSRTQYDGELAMILELSNGNEIYIPITTSDEPAEAALAAAIRSLLGTAAGPLVGFEIE